MMKKQILLSLISIAVLAGFFFLPANYKWASRITGYARDFNSERRSLDPEHRLRYRMGHYYIYSRQIAEHFAHHSDAQPILILLPPSSYFTKRGMEFHVPEPAVFYYYTGLKTVWPDSHEAIRATHYVRAVNQQLVVDSVTDLKSLQDSIAVFVKMGVSL